LAVHSFASCFSTVVDLAKLSDAQLVSTVRTEISSKTEPDYRGVHFVVLYSREKVPRPLDDLGGTLAERVQAHCQKLLDTAWATLKNSGEQVPIVLSVPKEAPDELYRAFARWVAAGQLPQEDRRRLGDGLEAARAADLELAARHSRNLRPDRMELLTPSSSLAPELASVKRNAASKDLVLASLFDAVYSQRRP